MGKHDFGFAFEAIKEGIHMTRRGWNGKGMYVFLIMTRRPIIAMKTADNEIVPWLASQTDLLAEDWEVAE